MRFNVAILLMVTVDARRENWLGNPDAQNGATGEIASQEKLQGLLFNRGRSVLEDILAFINIANVKCLGLCLYFRIKLSLYSFIKARSSS